MSRRSWAEEALRRCLALPRWRMLARRAALNRLYFRLRADGMGGREARRVVARCRRALPGLREEPKGLGVALDLILP